MRSLSEARREEAHPEKLVVHSSDHVGGDGQLVQVAEPAGGEIQVVVVGPRHQHHSSLGYPGNALPVARISGHAPCKSPSLLSVK